MPKPRLVTICKGLPASGKSTWAKEKVRQSQGSTKRINKDELRELLDGGKYSKSNEAYVLNTRDHMILMAMREGKNVIVDDTNLHPKHEVRIRELVDLHNKMADDLWDGETVYRYDVAIKDFTDVDPIECIKRDNARANGVGHDVIMKMYKKFIKKDEIVVEQPAFDPRLPTCVICDLDGTLANNNWRNPFDASKCDEDPLIDSTYQVLRMCDAAGYYIVLFSGRSEEYRQPTWNFVEQHNIPAYMLVMRKMDDNRKDSIVKREMYENHIKDRYNVLFVLDDRDQVVEMWRKELGLPCHQVNYGDF